MSRWLDYHDKEDYWHIWIIALPLPRHRLKMMHFAVRVIVMIYCIDYTIFLRIFMQFTDSYNENGDRHMIFWAREYNFLKWEKYHISWDAISRWYWNESS